MSKFQARVIFVFTMDVFCLAILIGLGCSWFQKLFRKFLSPEYQKRLNHLGFFCFFFFLVKKKKYFCLYYTYVEKSGRIYIKSKSL